MPQLNRDILREVFYEITNSDYFRRNVDKFMMAGKEPFNLVLDICKKAKDVVIINYGIIAKLPQIEYAEPSIDEVDEYGPVTRTSIYYDMKLFKPISVAVASSLSSLDIRGFSPEFIPMLKSIDQELKEVTIQDTNSLHEIFKACVNIPYVQDEVHILYKFYDYNFYQDMTAFAIPCRKLSIANVLFNAICPSKNLFNSHLSNIRDLTIKGTFLKTLSFNQELQEFAKFLLINFPNLETLNVKFSCYQYYWNWNKDGEMAKYFKVLPPGLKGCICFQSASKEERNKDNYYTYPGVQKNGKKYYKMFPITDTLSFKIAHKPHFVNDW